MNHLREIAKAHYENGSAETQELAHKFFDAMDTDGDRKVRLSEFKEFIKQEHAALNKPMFFQLLDKDENGYLDFDEVMTLYYIVRSRRPFCNECEMFITGTYYACAQCFRRPDASEFFLCHVCYLSREWYHEIQGRHCRCQLVDNYTLLQLKSYQGQASSPASESSGGYERIGSSTSNAIVLANQVGAVTMGRNNWKAALKAFEAALTAASIGTGAAALCTIL